jgi:hypothetical protein
MLSLTPPESAKVKLRAALREKNSRNSGAACSICEFQTTPPHDGRTHRNQKKKGPFSPAELKEKGLMKT